MKAKLLVAADQERQWALVFDAGDDVLESLKQFAADQRLTAAHFSGIGAFAESTVAWFDLDRQEYQPIHLDEQVEVLSLLGDVADDRGHPAVHAHICVAKRDGTAHGGHLQKGRVRPTLEVILSESPAHLRKTFRPEFGLALIDLSESAAADSGKPLSSRS